MKNNHGNLSLIIVASAALAGIAMVSLLTLSKLYVKQSVSSKVSQTVSSANQFNLELINRKFHIENKKIPLWYPVPYPTALQLSRVSPTFNPVIEVTKQAPAGTLTSIPLTVSGENYQLDYSGLGAVRKTSELAKNANGESTKTQTAQVASPDLNSMTPTEFKNLMLSPNLSWPKSSSTGLSSLAIAKVSFLKFVADTTYSTWARQLTVSITASDAANHSQTTTALLDIDAPPSPACSIKLAGGVQTVAVPAKGSVDLILSSDSLTTSANLTDNMNNVTQVPVTSPPSIMDLGVMTQIHKNTISLNVPKNLNNARVFTSGKFDGDTKWTINGKVLGIKNDGNDNPCSLDIAVAPEEITLPPNPPVTKKLCTVPSTNLKIVNGHGVQRPRGQYFGSIKFTLPEDATEIDFKGTRIDVDDYYPTIELNGKQIYTRPEYNYNKIAVWHGNLPLNFHAGENTLSGNHWNWNDPSLYGLYLYVQGTYKTAGPCTPP